MSQESPRIRRLRLDNEKINTRFSNSTLIRVVEERGFPPENYVIEYRIKGIYADNSGKVHEKDVHRLEINLSLGYPRRAPQCKMQTPIFHPNFDETSVCIGDFWAPSEGLDDLIVRIGRMIAFQEYNIKSPLNGLAAKWADTNSSMLPVDSREIAPTSLSLNIPKNEKIVIDIPTDSNLIPDFKSFFHEIITAESNQAPEPSLYFPRIDFGTISIQIVNSKTTIGRSLGNTIIIPMDDISLFHCEIECMNGSYILRDSNSTNGTYVNNILINETRINHGDKIRLGNIESYFLIN